MILDFADLALFWVLVLAFSLCVYVVLDGFDLGIGILFGTTRSETCRAAMLEAVAPVWDGNETWLLVVGAGLYGAFPVVYAVVLSGLYLPVALLLIALIFRGVAFEFRYKSRRFRWLWDLGFVLGSLLAAFVQGAAVGALVTELPVYDQQFAGGPFVWLNPFTVVCGLGLVLGYVLHGAAWLVLKTDGAVQDWAWRRILWPLAGVLVILVLVFVWAQAEHLDIMGRWHALSWHWVFPALGLLAAWGTWWGVKRRRDGVPFVMSTVLFLAAFGALAVSFAPYMIPYSITYLDGAAAEASLSFLFWGAGLFVLPVILVYTAVVYWVFRGKIKSGVSTSG